MELVHHTAEGFQGTDIFNTSRIATMRDGQFDRFVIEQSLDTAGHVASTTVRCQTAFGGLRSDRAHEYAKALHRAAEVAAVFDKDIGRHPAQIKRHRKALTGLCPVCEHSGTDCEGAEVNE